MAFIIFTLFLVFGYAHTVSATEVQKEVLGNYKFLTEDFSDWSIVDEGDFSAPSNWIMGNGTVTQTSNIYGGAIDSSNILQKGTYLLNTKGFDWSNYQITTTLSSTDNDSLGVMFRYVDSDNYYRISLDSERNYRRITKITNGQAELLAEEANGYVPGQEYLLTINVHGNLFNVELDNVQLFTGIVSDNDFMKGSFALYAWGNQTTVFHNVKVVRLDYECSSQTSKLQWQANVEPDLAGYRVYFSTTSQEHLLSNLQDNLLHTISKTEFSSDGWDIPSTSFDTLAVDYWFTVTAYDTSDNESEASTPVHCELVPDSDTQSPITPLQLQLNSTN